MAQTELVRWLEAEGLGDCAPKLVENDIDLRVLPDLTDADLIGIGLTVGVRRRLLRAAARLRVGADGLALPAAVEPSVAVATGERRYLTAMFCDLVDAKRLAAELDPKTWRELVQDFQVAVFDVARKFDGYYAQNLGDGALVYFGYPRAQENDAERAVRAGLALQESLARVNDRRMRDGKPVLRTRVGIDAGLVLLANDGKVLGEVPSVSALVQAVARPDWVLVSRAVHRLVAGLFTVEDQGEHALAGVPVPVPLFRVLRPSGVIGRRIAERGRTPLVGRGAELDLLSACWDRARTGEGQMVLLVGEPGMGKSRLVEELRGRLAEYPHSWVEWPNSQLLQNTPFHPLSEWSRQRFGGPEVADEVRLAEVERSLRDLGLDANTAVPLLHSVLEIPLPKRYGTLVTGHEELRRRQLEILSEWLLAGARAQAMVVAIEDAHWADPSTMELVRILVERGAKAPLLLLITARPEFRPTWNRRPHHSSITLGPLDQAEVLRMVGEVVARREMPVGWAERVVERSGGVPLFVEEVTRLMVEGGDRDRAQQVPMTLQASLTARLDRLGPARDIAQIAAVLGREFRLPLLQAVAPVAEAELHASLERLVEAGLLQTQGAHSAATYRFKHALIQDVAYDGMMESRRRELHRAVARALRERFKDSASGGSELLAHHLTEAGEAEAAIAAWETAAAEATARGAFAEVTAGVRRAIDILLRQPDSPGRAAKEFQLRTRLAECYWAAKGQSADETVAVFKEALAIGERVDDAKAKATILSGLVSATTQRAEFDAARALGEQLLALARDQGGAFARGWASFRRGQTSIYLGELAEARRFYDEALRLGDGEDRLAAGGVELVSAVTVFSPWLSALLGNIDVARDEAARRLAAAEKSGGPHNLAHVHLGCGLLDQSLGEAERVERIGRTLLAEGERYRMPIFVAYGGLLFGWAQVQLGRPEDGVEWLGRGIATLTAAGTKTLMNVYRARLARALADAGRLDEALAEIAAAESLAGAGPFLVPVVLRIKGELLLRRAEGGDAPAARDAFSESLALARRMGARLIEVETAVAAARHRAALGDEFDAGARLTEAIGRLNGGSDAALPRQGNALLAQIGGSISPR